MKAPGRYLIVIALAAVLWRVARKPDPLPAYPLLMLWAWERPEDLRFLRPGTAGIAFLARTVQLTATGVSARARFQPLQFPPGTPLMAVVRLESQGVPPAVQAAVREILEPTRLPKVIALQIDFDARASERPWYADLLRGLRAALPSGYPLTITALASWCEEKPSWLNDLPIDDATPMMFRMGYPNHRPVPDFGTPLCRSSLGVSTDELPPGVPRGRRLYFFRPAPWTLAAYEAALGQARRWQ